MPLQTLIKKREKDEKIEREREEEEEKERTFAWQPTLYGRDPGF